MRPGLQHTLTDSAKRINCIPDLVIKCFMSHSEWMTRILRNAILLTFGVELVIYAIVSSMSFNNPALLDSFRSQQTSIISQSPLLIFFAIFTHNLLVATLDFIPAFGTFLFVQSAISTAMIISLQGTAAGVPGLALFLTLLLLPHSWLELPVYAISMTGGIYLIYSLLKGKAFLRENLTRTVYIYFFAVVQLAIAGAFEAAEIYFETSYSSPDNAIYPLMMWIPAVPVFYVLHRLFKQLMAMPSRLNDVPP